VNVAPPPAFSDRPIGRANGPDLPFPGHFTKKSSDFTKINPQSNLLSQKILQKKPSASYEIKSQVNVLSQFFFVKKTSNFSEIQPAIQAFLGWLAPRSVGLSRPNSAQSWFALSIIFFPITNKFAQTLKLRSKSQKIIK